jgi:hypothetical protein
MLPRTSRVHLAIPVFVYGRTKSGNPFKEITQTITINANGALIELATPVEKGQSLVVTNMKTEDDIAVQVVTLGDAVSGKLQVGVRFEEASPRFWGLGFPPEDWDPADRKRPDKPPRSGSR